MSTEAMNSASTSTTTSQPSAPAAGTPPVSAPATPGTAPASTSSDWTTGFNDELKGYVQNKGFKDPSSVLDSYRNLEKAIGVPSERLIKLPADQNDPAAMAEVYAKLGRPGKPDDYKIDVPQGQGDDFAKWARGTFHELGLTAPQAEVLSKKWNELQAQMGQAQSQSQEATFTQQRESLKREWGAAYEQNAKVVDKAAQALGIDAQTLDALKSSMGVDKAMKFLHSIGSKTLEDSFVSGKDGSQFGVMTPEAAKSRISQLRNDPDFSSRYLRGESNAINEMSRLHEMANHLG
jgi:hypothetical protein